MSTEPSQDSPRVRALESFKELVRKNLLQRQSSGTSLTSPRRPSIDSPLHLKLKNPDEKPTTDLLLRLLLRKDKPDEIGQMLYRSFKEHKFFRNLAKSYTHIEEDEAFSHIMKSSSLEVFSANQLIYKEGENSNGKIYLVLLGEVDIYKRNNRTPKVPNTLGVASSHHRRPSNASSFDGRSQIILEADDSMSVMSSDDELTPSKERQQNHHHRKSLLKPGDTFHIHNRKPSFSGAEATPKPSRFALTNDSGQRKSFMVNNHAPDHSSFSAKHELAITKQSSDSTPGKKSLVHQDSRNRLLVPDSTAPTISVNSNTQESPQKFTLSVPSLAIPSPSNNLPLKDETPKKNTNSASTFNNPPTLNIPTTLSIPIQSINNAEQRKSFLAPTNNSMEPRKSFLSPSNSGTESRKSTANVEIPPEILSLLPMASRKSIMVTTEDGVIRRKSFLGQDNEIKLSTGKKNHDIIVHQYEQYGDLEEKKLKDDYFGDKILGKEKKRTETAIAVARTECVVLKRQAFEALEKKFNKMKMQFKQHMMKFFPSIGDYSSKTFLETLFLMTEDIEMVRDTHVVKEGQHGDFIYSLVEGTCEIYKQITVEDQSPTKGDFERLGNLYRHSKGRVMEVPYAKIERGAFVGEEILIEGVDKYNYTVRIISSHATFLRVNKNAMLSSFPKECASGIITAYNFKHNNHKKSLNKVLTLRGLACTRQDLNTNGIIRVKKGEQGNLMNYSPNQHHKEKLKRDITPLIVTEDSVEFKIDIRPASPIAMSPRKILRSQSKKVVDPEEISGSEPSSPKRSLTRMESAAQMTPSANTAQNSPRMSPVHNQSPSILNKKKTSFFTLTAHPVLTDPGHTETQYSEFKGETSPTKRGGDFGSLVKHLEMMDNHSPIPEVPTPSARNFSIKPRPITTESSIKRSFTESSMPIPKALFCSKKDSEPHIDLTSFVSPRKGSTVKFMTPTHETHFSQAQAKAQAQVQVQPQAQAQAEKKPERDTTPIKVPIRFQHIPKLANFDKFIEKMTELKKYDPNANSAQINSLAANLKAMTGLTPKKEEKLTRTRDMLMKHRMGVGYASGTKKIPAESLADYAEKRLKNKAIEIQAKEDERGDFLIISLPMTLVTSPQTARSSTTRATTRNISPRVTNLMRSLETTRAGPVKPILISSQTTLAHTRTQSGAESVSTTKNDDPIIESKSGSTRISPAWSSKPSSYFDLDSPSKPISSRFPNTTLMKKVGGFATRAGPSTYVSTSKEALECVIEAENRTPKATPAKKVMRRVKSAHIYVQNGSTTNKSLS